MTKFQHRLKAAHDQAMFKLSAEKRNKEIGAGNPAYEYLVQERFYENLIYECAALAGPHREKILIYFRLPLEEQPLLKECPAHWK